MRVRQAREEIARYCHRFRADGLVVGTAGNLSVRVGDLVAITPSGLDYDAVTPELVCVVRYPDGAPVAAPLAPASELPLHLAALRATGADAVVHTHSTAATAVASIAGLVELPNIHYYAALFGGRVRITEYARFGTQELADTVAAALKDRTGWLMGNHGALAVGRDLAQAYDKALQLEWMCEVFLRASRYGTPRLLPDEEIAAVARLMAGYGQRPPPDTPS
jgi:L-fuculose-phosphate aldolase